MFASCHPTDGADTPTTVGLGGTVLCSHVLVRTVKKYRKAKGRVSGVGLTGVVAVYARWLCHTRCPLHARKLSTRVSLERVVETAESGECQQCQRCSVTRMGMTNVRNGPFARIDSP